MSSEYIDADDTFAAFGASGEFALALMAAGAWRASLDFLASILAQISSGGIDILSLIDEGENCSRVPDFVVECCLEGTGMLDACDGQLLPRWGAFVGFLGVDGQVTWCSESDIQAWRGNNLRRRIEK